MMGNFDPRSIRNGKFWWNLVNREPLAKTSERSVLALGTCKADGSGYKPYDKPIERRLATGSYLWLNSK